MQLMFCPQQPTDRCKGIRHSLGFKNSTEWELGRRIWTNQEPQSSRFYLKHNVLSSKAALPTVVQNQINRPEGSSHDCLFGRLLCSIFFLIIIFEKVSSWGLKVFKAYFAQNLTLTTEDSIKSACMWISLKVVTSPRTDKRRLSTQPHRLLSA